MAGISEPAMSVQVELLLVGLEGSSGLRSLAGEGRPVAEAASPKRRVGGYRWLPRRSAGSAATGGCVDEAPGRRLAVAASPKSAATGGGCGPLPPAGGSRAVRAGPCGAGR